MIHVINKNTLKALYGLLFLTFTGNALAAGELLGGDMQFHGTVVALPCSIVPGDENVLVDFKQISTKDIYAEGKVKVTPFTLHLTNCTSAVLDTVTVTFSGTEEPELPDHIAIQPTLAGGASGVGIGMEEKSGTPIKLNQPTSATKITTGNMALTFQAYVEGTKSAIENKNIPLGPFTATANYTLNYQ